jgi:hypothetical protein
MGVRVVPVVEQTVTRRAGDRVLMWRLIRLFCLLSRGRPILDFTASKEGFEALSVPHTSSSHWSGFSA